MKVKKPKKVTKKNVEEIGKTLGIEITDILETALKNCDNLLKPFGLCLKISYTTEKIEEKSEP